MALSALEQVHLGMMLHSLGLRPFQQTMGLQRLGASKLGDRSAVGGGYQGSLQEAAEAPDLAYGFTLGLVYFRYLKEELRYLWDCRIKEILDTTQNGVNATLEQQRKLQIQKSQATPGLSVALGDRIETLDNYFAASTRIADLLRSLYTKKVSTFSNNSNEAVNEVETVLANPWCLTNTEFAWAWAYERSGPLTFLSLPEAARPEESGTKQAAEEWAKAGATELTKAGIVHLAEALGYTATAIVFSPDALIGLTVGAAIGVTTEALKASFARRTARRLNSYYRVEHERRVWLSSSGVQWSDYT